MATKADGWEVVLAGPRMIRLVPREITVRCTGLAATWCPIHGDCTCPNRDEPNRDDGFNHHVYPLHGHDSDHAAGTPGGSRRPDASAVQRSVTHVHSSMARSP